MAARPNIAEAPEQSKFYLLCRGAAVYVAARPNIAEAREQSKFYLLCRGWLPRPDGELQDNDADKQKKILTLREFDEFNSLNYIELPIKEQVCGLRQVPRRGGRKGVAPLNKGLSPQVTGGGQTGFLKGPYRAAPERQRGFLQGNRSSAGAGVAKRSRMPHRGCHRR